jgi:hypothetical protein
MAGTNAIAAAVSPIESRMVWSRLSNDAPRFQAELAAFFVAE